MAYPLNICTTISTDLLPSSPSSSSSQSPASTWLSRALVHMYGFNHEESIECFNKAMSFPNPSLELTLLCHLMIGSCSGPNYNFHAKNGYFEYAAFNNSTGNFPSSKVGFEAVVTGLQLFDENEASGKEVTSHARMLKDLLSAESCKHSPPGRDPSLGPLFLPTTVEAYKKVYEKYPNVAEISFLYAQNLMLLHPWNLFEYPSGSPYPHTSSAVSEISSILSSALESYPNHFGLCHLHVHFLEMSETPERALPSCKVLRNAVDCSHLLHMSTHIDVLIGDYQSAVVYNTLAVEADLKMFGNLKSCGRSSFFLGYVCHDYHMKIYAALLGGFEGMAREGSEGIKEVVNEAALLENKKLLDGCEGFLSLGLHVDVRFGRWERILDQKLNPVIPSESEFCVSAATLRWARGMALAVQGRCVEARVEREILLGLLPVIEEKGRYLHNNTLLSTLTVESEKLLGEILYFEDKKEEAFEVLRNAVVLDDGLNYDEPWGVMNPARHALGALLVHATGCGCTSNEMRVKYLEEAEEVFRADLKLHPKNPWSMKGLYDCLFKGRGGQGVVNSEVDEVGADLVAQRSNTFADFTIESSCECGKRRRLK
ncbi:hypothetical protein TrST_g12352 [Triparma strigata]|uniref:Uncharacterized protein n=1 Tax=Triparma strigata TaxID=1606541 RepID=A0A9W7AE63_9STRA|nr:hypothetical protein TrST_g12352 [Triparma strigata]